MLVPGSRERVDIDLNTFNQLRSAAKATLNDSGTSNETTKRVGYPYNTPNTKSTWTSRNTLFETSITDIDRRQKYRRGIGGAIVDKIVDDALKNGFYIDKSSTSQEPDRTQTTKFQKIYQEKVSVEFDKALKLARLYGYSLVLMGFKDGQDLSEPVTNTNTPIDYVMAIPKSWIYEIVYETEDGMKSIPPKIERFRLSPYKFAKGTSIHASRVLLIENPGLNDDETSIISVLGGDDLSGTSVLDRPFDIITVIDHMIWSTGQTMWRYSGGLLSILMPPDADPEDQQTVLDTVGDVNAKTVLTFPDGYKPDLLSTASAALNPGPYFDKMMEQLAGVTEYPKTILYGLSTGAVTGSQLDRSTYYSKVVVKQKWIGGYLKAILERFAPEEKDWTIVWNSPYEATEKEKLENQKLRAQIDTEKVNSFVMTPDEMRERDGRPKLTTEQITLLKFAKSSQISEKINPSVKDPNTKLQNSGEQSGSSQDAE
jgi:phage-related protein (TIGR01555 family)